MIISNQKRLAADILSRREGRTVGIHRNVRPNLDTLKL